MVDSEVGGRGQEEEEAETETGSETFSLRRLSWVSAKADRSRTKTYAALGAIGFLLLIHLAFVFGEVVGDAGVFMTIGAGWLDGNLPYVRYIDHKPPGIYALLAATFAIERSVFAAKLLVLLANVATAGVVYWLGRKLLSRDGALVAVTLFLAGSLVYDGVSVYTEPFVALASVLAMAAFLTGERTGQGRYYAATGLLAGIAILFKQPGGAVLLGLVAYVLLTARRRSLRRLPVDVALLVSTAALPYLIAAGYFYANDALSEFVYWTVLVHGSGGTYATQLHAVLGGNLREVLRFPLLWVLALTGLATLMRGRESERLELLAVLTAFSLLPLLIRGWDHYYLQPLPFAALVAGLSYERIIGEIKPMLARFETRTALVLVTVFLLLPSLQVVGTAGVNEIVSSNVFDDIETGAYINARTEPGDPILVVGEHAKLYFLSDREPINRHLYYLTINSDLYDEQRIIGTLQREEVKYVVVNEPCEPYLPTVCEYVSSNYELDRVDGSLHIYRRPD